MSKKSKSEYDSMKDIAEYQRHMYSPGHYVGNGKVPPIVSAPGNAMPMVILYGFGAVLFAALGLILIFSDVQVGSSGLVDSPVANKIITVGILFLIAAFCMWMGFGYFKRTKRYRAMKAKMEREAPDKTVEDRIAKRACPKCGKSHDIDDPKCPHCKHRYTK